MFTKKMPSPKRHRLPIWLLLLTILLLAACNSGPPPTPASTPSEDAATATSPALMPVPTNTGDPAAPITPDPTAAAYPDPAGEETAAPANDSYPVPPSPVPTTDPYPGGLVWIIRPVGTQCEPETPPGYGSLNEAVATLFAAGVSVQASETIELSVTTACGSPTSEHYRVQIGANHLSTVGEMGWMEEEN
jgi:hypothetical protein